MSYGLAYGLSAFGLSKQLRIDRAEAKQLMTDYFERFGAVRDYLRGVVEQAKIDGYTRRSSAAGGRSPTSPVPNRVLRENAERRRSTRRSRARPPTSSSSRCRASRPTSRRRGSARRMLLQVHDELVFEVAPGELEALEAIVARPDGARRRAARAARRADRHGARTGTTPRTECVVRRPISGVGPQQVGTCAGNWAIRPSRLSMSAISIMCASAWS